jgi:hypothetical protein
MALLEHTLVIKNSTLPGAGKGLFTKKFIPKGTRIVEYKGRVTTWKAVEHDHDNAYLFTVHAGHVIDAKRSYKALARYANDARGFTRVKGITNNCLYYRDENDRVFLESKQDIPAGSEIFVSYGNDYWKVMRENRRIEQERQQEEAAGTARKTGAAKKGKAAKKATTKSKATTKASAKAKTKAVTKTKTKATAKTKLATKAKSKAKR